MIAIRRIETDCIRNNNAFDVWIVKHKLNKDAEPALGKDTPRNDRYFLVVAARKVIGTPVATREQAGCQRVVEADPDNKIAERLQRVKVNLDVDRFVDVNHGCSSTGLHNTQPLKPN